MSNLPSDFDLKFLPDWLKNPSPKNPYANFAPQEERIRHGHNDRRGKQDRRRHAPASNSEARGGNKPALRKGRDADKRHRPARTETPRETAPNLAIEFFPEPQLVASLGKQIKESGRAYPLLELARMFMDKPERHRIRITSKSPDVLLHQCGEEASLDKALAEKPAFHQLKEIYYTVEISERDPIKGNFTSVARCRASGTLLGPTNHHSYHPNLHRLYEQRFSRRMSFHDFSRQIEIISDPTVVESWKEEARKVVIYRTIKEAEQLSFSSEAQAEQHFRKTYLPGLVHSATSVDLSGLASRSLSDRRLLNAVRSAWEKQRGFPGQIMHHLRQQLQNSGLHWFRNGSAQHLTGIRPSPINKTDQNLSENISSILTAIDAAKGCTRASLAASLLPSDSQELEKLKTGLASDLHWLIDSGHVIEFADGHMALAPIEKAGSKTAKSQKEEEPAAAEPAQTVEPPAAVNENP